jgi:hypothetical protein
MGNSLAKTNGRLLMKAWAMMIHKLHVLKLGAVATVLVAGCGGSALAADGLAHCNVVQNRVGFIRYPLGTIGAWSTTSGEAADVVTRAPRIYPCVKEVVLRPDKEDWRASITGDPSRLTIRYRGDRPSGASTVAITVAPHVSVFKATFPEDAKERRLVLDFRKATVDNWARLYKWTDRAVTRMDNRTLHATVNEPAKKGAFYVIRFSAPCVASGFIDASGKVPDGAAPAPGTEPCLYAKFDAPTVTVAVAESFTSLKQAEAFLAAEFTDFDTVHERCRAAWNEVLNRVEVEGSEDSKRMAYTALYTMVVNLIDGSDGSYYAGVCPISANIRGFRSVAFDFAFAPPGRAETSATAASRFRCPRAARARRR